LIDEEHDVVYDDDLDDTPEFLEEALKSE